MLYHFISFIGIVNISALSIGKRVIFQRKESETSQDFPRWAKSLRADLRGLSVQGRNSPLVLRKPHSVTLERIQSAVKE